VTMTVRECKERLRGVIPVQTCPYTQDGTVDLEGLRDNTLFLLDFAQDGNRDMALLTNADTTEFYANSIEDQKRLIKTVVDTVAGRMPVIVGVSQPAAGQAVWMAKQAEELGADCVMALPPYLHKPTKEGVYQFYEMLAASVSIGVVPYNYPNVAGTLFPPDLLVRLSRIDNVVGVKNCTPNSLDAAVTALSVDPREMVLIDGLGELTFVGNAAYGDTYRAFISVSANFAPHQSYEIYEAVKAGDSQKAREGLKRTFVPLADFMSRVQASRGDTISALPWWMGSSTTFIAVTKCAMDLVGLRGGTYHVAELPMEPLTDEEKGELRVVLRELGIT